MRRSAYAFVSGLAFVTSTIVLINPGMAQARSKGCDELNSGKTFYIAFPMATTRAADAKVLGGFNIGDTVRFYVAASHDGRVDVEAADKGLLDEFRETARTKDIVIKREEDRQLTVSVSAEPMSVVAVWAECVK